MTLTIIEFVLCTPITVWFISATKSDLRRLRRIVRTAERIMGATLPTLQELYSSRVSKSAGKIILDPSHPAHSLFELLPSGHATELWAPEQPDTETVSFPKQSSHEHLTLNMEHTTLLYITCYTLLVIHHTYLFFISNWHISDLYTHTVLSVNEYTPFEK